MHKNHFLSKDSLKLPLEQRQNKNGTIWSISKLILKLPLFFTTCIGEWKSAANSKLICLSTKWSRSYIVLALETKTPKCGMVRDLIGNNPHTWKISWQITLLAFNINAHFPRFFFINFHNCNVFLVRVIFPPTSTIFAKF